MPLKLLTPNEFDSLQLPIELSPKMSEACRHVFIMGESFRSAAKLCGITEQRQIEQLFSTIQIINRYLEP